jgi:hypothetical protein
VELVAEIEKERDKVQQGEEISGLGSLMSPADDQGIKSPMISAIAPPPYSTEDAQAMEVTKKSDSEGDVKMEDT